MDDIEGERYSSVIKTPAPMASTDAKRAKYLNKIGDSTKQGASLTVHQQEQKLKKPGSCYCVIQLYIQEPSLE